MVNPALVVGHIWAKIGFGHEPRDVNGRDQDVDNSREETLVRLDSRNVESESPRPQPWQVSLDATS